MPVTYGYTTGGLVTGGNQQPLVDFQFNLPDAFGGNVTFSGVVSPAPAAGGLGAGVVMTGSPIAMPAVPGVGGQSLIWGLQVNTATGVVSIKTGAAAASPVAPTADAGNLLLFTHTIANADVTPWARAPTLIDLN